MPLSVLVIDDDADSRRAARDALASEGIAVVGETADALIGLALAQAERPSVVLLGVGVPGMDTAEATRGLRDRAPGTQVILLTGYADAAPLPSAEDIGAFAYVIKGCRPALLGHVIRRAAAYGGAIAPVGGR